MKKFIGVLVILIAAVYGYFELEANTITGAVTSSVSDVGSVEVFFCPGCEERFVSLLESGRKLDCAFYDIGLESVADVLREKKARVIMDNHYAHKYDGEKKEDRSGLMHHKFCIIDGEKVVTGSMNPTSNGVNKNDNNIVVIESPVIVKNYQDEFEEMWSGVFKSGEAVATVSVTVDDVLVKSFFCPDDGCMERVRDELRAARSSIYFMTFSFTHHALANTLLVKNLEGVDVKGVMEARQIGRFSKFDVLRENIGEVYKDANKQTMHHKVFIVDETCVVTGSMNPSAGGDERNDENVLVLCDEEIASVFVDEFWKVFGAAQEKEFGSIS